MKSNKIRFDNKRSVIHKIFVISRVYGRSGQKKMCTQTGWRPVRPDVPARDIFYADIPARIMDDPANSIFLLQM